MKKIVLSLILLTSCAHKVQIKTPVVILHEGWAARQESDDTFTVWAIDKTHEAAAKEALCTKSYVCVEQPNGRVFIIERHWK